MPRTKVTEFGCFASIIYIVVVVLAFIGYFRCIYNFIDSDFEPSYKREIVYGIGIVTPLGTIIGWLDIEDTKKE